MRIGTFSDTEKTVQIEIKLNCIACGKRVPGGIRTGEQYSKSGQFQKDIKKLKKDYLCGICRDKKRTRTDRHLDTNSCRPISESARQI